MLGSAAAAAASSSSSVVPGVIVAKKYIASILGGTGSVGKNVLRSILADQQCEKVIVISRRPLDKDDDFQKLVSFEDPTGTRIIVKVCDPLDEMISTNTNIAFCTIGHGSSRNATKDDLMKVDATIPGKFALACKDAGVSHYCIMTATGADINSSWNFFTRTGGGGGYYNHVKGVAEKLTLDANISYTYIAQPAALLNSPHTPKVFDYVPNSILPMKHTSATINDIAKGMVKTTIDAYQNNRTGVVRITGGIPISLSSSEE
ncbi:hypothetical protein FRACYDRAFT_258326 [Fragilariopsis cylindrus CCMP1102]|uniref:NAD(P)-binding domain-containing protein n=1 Tax=Fragilariopsis cylindrus CCMP1102 TaxID=635003 RepID=A0A1E7EJH0_9STRA|nr:hypothetical protein FRACYDRAFT_258326 [Fragilariopsis cylindrus CCMP1102]|eukprot:OEU05773.1 hypothetical protein FRACYDRAFT_258326 [Fragilariopsis cylindrus CCMP1102]